MIALLYVVAAAGAVTQKECAFVEVQSMSEVHPDAMQKPAEQMLAGGLQSVSFVQAMVQAPIMHAAIGLPSCWMQSLAVVHVPVLHRCVAPSQVLPAAQSRSWVHVK